MQEITEQTKFRIISDFLGSPTIFIKTFASLMAAVQILETDNYGFKMCRKVVEVYYDDTKEILFKVKKENRLNSLFEAVYLMVFYVTNKIGNESYVNFCKRVYNTVKINEQIVIPSPVQELLKNAIAPPYYDEKEKVWKVLVKKENSSNWKDTQNACIQFRESLTRESKGDIFYDDCQNVKK